MLAGSGPTGTGIALRLLPGEFAADSASVGTTMIGELLAEVGHLPLAELDAGARAKHLSAVFAPTRTGESRASRQLAERVENVLVVSSMTYLSMKRIQSRELQVGLGVRPDSGSVGK